MHKLDSRSAKILLSALEDLHSDADPSTLPDRAVAAANRIIGNDFLTFDFFSRSPRYEDTAWSNNPEVLNPEVMRTFGALLHQHPIVKIALDNPNGEALKITDAVSQRSFERTELFNEFYRKLDVRKQMGLALLSEGDLTMTCAFARKSTDFTDREKTIASLAAPHFVNAIKNGIAFARLSEAMEAGGSGVIALNVNGTITFSSRFARVLIEKYFPGEAWAANSLPRTLAAWLRSSTHYANLAEYKSPAKPLRLECENGKLTVRLLDCPSTREEILLFEETKKSSPQNFLSLGLTQRESEVLHWITEGKADADIAILCGISIRTVQKHVEHIYTKLGVETRTAAVSRAAIALS